MKKITYWGKPKNNVNVTRYILYVNTQKGKRKKWAGECSERIEIDNRLNKYFDNNDYVSATIVCEYTSNNVACNYIEYVTNSK